MRAPVSWIRDLVDLPDDLDIEKLADALTDLGLKLESVERPGDAISGPLVVGRVLTMDPEPQKNGKTINWCTVDVADANGTGDPQGIVCGAHNFAPGDLVVVVLPGAVLPGDFEISARKTYGHVSAGMICSAAELGLGEDHDGIIVLPDGAGEPGEDARPVLGLDDTVLEFEINPDRAYALSMRGVAREAALAHDARFRDPVLREVPPADDQGHPVRRGGPDRLPGVRRPHRLGVRPDGRDARLAGAPDRPGRDAPDLAGGRRHQLRDARDRPPDPRLRRRQGAGRDRRPPCPRRRAADDPGRQRPDPRSRSRG